MADTAEAGVVDSLGRLYEERTGILVHEGLRVVDGAIVPRSLGATPLATISALADRIAEDVVSRMKARQ